MLLCPPKPEQTAFATVFLILAFLLVSFSVVQGQAAEPEASKQTNKNVTEGAETPALPKNATDQKPTFASTFVTSDGEQIRYGFTKQDIPWLVIPPVVIVLGLVIFLVYYMKTSNLLGDSEIPIDLNTLSSEKTSGSGSSWIQDQVREALEAKNKDELIISKYRPPALEAPPTAGIAQKPVGSSEATISKPALVDEVIDQDNGLQSLDLEEDEHPPRPLAPLVPPFPHKPAASKIPFTSGQYSGFEDYVQQSRANGKLLKYLGDFPLPVQPYGVRYTTNENEAALVLPRMESPETLRHALTENQLVLVFHQGGVFEIRLV